MPTSPSTLGTSAGGSSTATHGARGHRGRSPQVVGHDRGRRPSREPAGLGTVHHRPGRLRRDAQVRRRVAGPGVGGRRQQRCRAAAGAATARRWRTCCRRAGQAGRPGSAVRHRSQPQDRRPRRALDRGRRSPHHDVAGWPGWWGTDHRPPRALTRRRVQTVEGDSRRCWPNTFRDRPNATSPRQAKTMLATSPTDIAGKTRRRLAAEDAAGRGRGQDQEGGHRLSGRDRARLDLMDLHGVGPVVAARVRPSGDSPGSPTATASRPGPAPHPWTRPPVRESPPVIPGPGTGEGTHAPLDGDRPTASNMATAARIDARRGQSPSSSDRRC